MKGAAELAAGKDETKASKQAWVHGTKWVSCLAHLFRAQGTVRLNRREEH